MDKDKPNTANSELSYNIINGNNDKKFSIEGSGNGRAVLVLRKRLDYDTGERNFMERRHNTCTCMYHAILF